MVKPVQHNNEVNSRIKTDLRFRPLGNNYNCCPADAYNVIKPIVMVEQIGA